MYTLMIAMNICSNGLPVRQEALANQERLLQEDGGPLARLWYHRALWRLRGFGSYQYTLSWRGMPASSRDLRVRVEAGEVVSVFTLGQNSQPRTLPAEACSIDDYFQLIGEALTADPGSVVVDYHSFHGYPSSIAMAHDESIADLAAELGYRTA